MTVECQSCGWNLEVPYGTAEGREFACGHCGLLLRNVEPTRRFRWDSVDPFVRRHGATRLGLWAGGLAGLLWLPAIAASLVVRHRFDPGFLAALGVPWCAIELWLARRRIATPSVRWHVFLWIGAGAFAMYAALLVAVIPSWRPLLGLGDDPEALKLLFVLGVMATMVGAAGASLYGWILRRTPRARATPPEDARAGSGAT
ncbi:MAG TPA: hypothetical protein VLT47_06875 [Anaeromyxobacteraceae bacterium]|nr:hypothetical protein [Anaeromyxobacteraceae bacterium]